MQKDWGLVVVGVVIVAVAWWLWEGDGTDDGTTDGSTDDFGGLMNYTGNLIQTEEGDRLTAYPDAGSYSIGYGHHGSDVTAGETITEDQAQAYLAADIQTAENFVNKHVTVPLTQSQYNGLVDFVYNLGVGKAGAKSNSVFPLVNSGDFDAVAAKLEEYVYSNGKKLASLLPRRIAEAAGFEDAE